MRKLQQTSSCAVFTNQCIEGPGPLTELDWTEQTKIQEYYDRPKDAVEFTLCNLKSRYFSQNFRTSRNIPGFALTSTTNSILYLSTPPLRVSPIVVTPSSPRTSEYLTADTSPSVLRNPSDYPVNTSIAAPSTLTTRTSYPWNSIRSATVLSPPRKKERR